MDVYIGILNEILEYIQNKKNQNVQMKLDFITSIVLSFDVENSKIDVVVNDNINDIVDNDDDNEEDEKRPPDNVIRDTLLENNPLQNIKFILMDDYLKPHEKIEAIHLSITSYKEMYNRHEIERLKIEEEEEKMIIEIERNEKFTDVKNKIQRLLRFGDKGNEDLIYLLQLMRFYLKEIEDKPIQGEEINTEKLKKSVQHFKLDGWLDICV